LGLTENTHGACPEVFPVRGHPTPDFQVLPETAGSSDIEKEKEPDHG